MSEEITGIVYLIGSKNTDKIYVGSTTKRLEKRLKQHIYAYKYRLSWRGYGYYICRRAKHRGWPEPLVAHR